MLSSLLASWQNKVELVFCIASLYVVFSYMTQKRSIRTASATAGLLTVGYIAWLLSLSTILLIIACLTPFIFFVALAHRTDDTIKDTLQNITHHAEWIERLFTLCIKASHNQITLTCICEGYCSTAHDNPLPLILDAPLTQSSCDFIIQTILPYGSGTIWITKEGVVKSLHTGPMVRIPFSTQTYEENYILTNNHITRTYTVTALGKKFENISSHYALNLFKQLYHRPETGEQMGRTIYQTLSAQAAPFFLACMGGIMLWHMALATVTTTTKITVLVRLEEQLEQYTYTIIPKTEVWIRSTKKDLALYRATAPDQLILPINVKNFAQGSHVIPIRSADLFLPHTIKLLHYPTVTLSISP